MDWDLIVELIIVHLDKFKFFSLMKLFNELLSGNFECNFEIKKNDF
jgi:hypothetical protein